MGVMPFLVKNCWTLRAVWADALVDHPSWNGQISWKSPKKKNSLKPNTASHNTTSWYTDTDGFLEHSPSRGSLYYKGCALQNIILGFLGPPSYNLLHSLLICFQLHFKNVKNRNRLTDTENKLMAARGRRMGGWVEKVKQNKNNKIQVIE